MYLFFKFFPHIYVLKPAYINFIIRKYKFTFKMKTFC